MGWMYYALLKKDVFVETIVHSKNRIIPVTVIWYNDVEQRWGESNIEWFSPPREKGHQR